MEISGLKQFRDNNPLLAMKPLDNSGFIVLEGSIVFHLENEEYPTVNKSYDLLIKIPDNFPYELPIFEEVSRDIPRDGQHHTNYDGTLCLGSPLRLKLSLAQDKDFSIFCEKFLEPYIYQVSLKIDHSIDFPFGELNHGDDGEIEDYALIFGVKGKDEVVTCLHALSLKKRIANKQACPCSCDNRLGKCSLHTKLNEFRNNLPRRTYAEIRNRLDR